jgi:hypothetical protein
VKQAKVRLKLLGAAKEDADLLSPGGKFDGRPADYALAKYQFFACSKCHQPYFGGLKECGAAQQPVAAHGRLALANRHSSNPSTHNAVPDTGSTVCTVRPSPDILCGQVVQ